MKKVLVTAVLLIMCAMVKAQSFEFIYGGKSLPDGSIVTIQAKEDVWGQLSCETNPSSNPQNGLMLKLLKGGTADVKLELKIEQQTLEADVLQWCMGGSCIPFGNKDYLMIDASVSGTAPVMFDATNVTSEGFLLAKLTATMSLEQHTVFIRFINGGIVSVRGDVNGDGVANASDIVEIVNIIMGKK